MLGFNEQDLISKVIGRGIKLSKDKFKRYFYRPFNNRTIYWDTELIDRPRSPLSLSTDEAISICLSRNSTLTSQYSSVLVSGSLTDLKYCEYSRGCYFFPLYVCNGKEVDLNPRQQQSLIPTDQPALKAGGKRANIKQEFAELLKKNFGTTPEEIFYYIYAILYSNIYRKKYEEFLKIDFPRIPFTKDYKLFQKLAVLGEELVSLHLLKHSALNKPIVKFYGKDSNLVEKREYKHIRFSKPKVATGPRIPQKSSKTGLVIINDKQYFAPVDPEIWNYYIGGYQVLDKWLKDRKGRSLSSEDIKHYCKVATSLSKTLQIQKKIDELYPRVEKNLVVIKDEN